MTPPRQPFPRPGAEQSTPCSGPPSAGVRWLRFTGGAALLALLAGFFMSGHAPPGRYGEVLRHNQEHAIDASPLFYSEVEEMRELEEGARRLWRTRASR